MGVDNQFLLWKHAAMMKKKPTHPLTKFRLSRGQNLEAFASEIGAHKGTVWKWENGAIPRPEWMRKIVEFSGGELSPSDWYSDGDSQ